MRRCSSSQTDLTNNTVGRYNLDHAGSVQRHALGVEHRLHLRRRHLRSRDRRRRRIALGDNFLSMIVPEIEASQAFKNNGEIVIWNDETEGDEDSRIDRRL